MILFSWVEKHLVQQENSTLYLNSIGDKWYNICVYLCSHSLAFKYNFLEIVARAMRLAHGEVHRAHD